MRNKHLELRRRIEDTKLAITDAELFGSRLYGAVLSDIAKSVTHRYRRKCRVLTYWDESPDADVASTNNRTIKINAANRMTASFPTRKLKDLSLRGLLGHEIGHILYTDFNMASVYTSKLLAGEFYPAEPTGKGKPVADKGDGPIDAETLKELRKKARDVLEEEGGRIALTETESIDTGEGGVITEDPTYAGAGYDKAAADIERVLRKLAEARVCAQEEEVLEQELQDFSDRIRYGNAHRGVDIEIDRMAEVPDKLIAQYDRVAGPLLKISRRLQKQVRQVLQDQRRGGRETGLLMGRRILTRTLYHDDGRYFYKNRLPQELPELAVALLVDESGSMSCADRITRARAASLIVYDFCRSLGIPILIAGHTEIGHTVHIYSYAEFDARDNNDRYRLMDLSARSDNRDGAALRYTAERLLRRPEEVKLLLTISDGQPCASRYYGTEAEADLRGIKREMTNRGVTIFAAAIGEDKDSIERIYGDGFLDISNLDDLPVSLTRLIAQRIRRR